MSVKCVWCGKNVDEVQGQATMDTCDECEDFFEEHIDDIAESLNELLKKNESSSSKATEKKAWVWLLWMDVDDFSGRRIFYTGSIY